MLGTIVRMAAGGGTFFAANSAIYTGVVALGQKAAGKVAEQYKAPAFYAAIGAVGTVAGALELLGLKTFFHDYGNKGPELLGLEGHMVDASPVAKTDVAK